MNAAAVSRQDRILTPSKITAWLDCAHFLTLQHQVDSGVLAAQSVGFGPMAQLLLEKGQEHERACMAGYRAEGKAVYEVPGRANGESFAAWVKRVGNPLADGHDVIYQMPFVHDRVRGIADFLIRVDHADRTFSYEPVDAKLARAEAKPGHLLQLCFYADAIENLTGTRPVHVHISLGSGRTETHRLAEVIAYWHRLRRQLVNVMERDIDTSTGPEPCAHCEFCRFANHCESQWRAEDSLVFVAGVRTGDRAALAASAVTTLADLAVLDAPVTDLDDTRRKLLAVQAALQVQARLEPESRPPFTALMADTDEATGLATLPEPNAGDVFLDYEGHPFWRPDCGLLFLFGWLTHDPSGGLSYHDWWAHDLAQEAEMTERFITYLAERRAEFPGMHVYHYNHTERSALEQLAGKHGVGEIALRTLIDGGLFIDLLTVVRQSMQVGVESYGLKEVERLTGYERGHEIDKGASAVVEYEAYMRDRDPARLVGIARYNEDDVRATHALLNWLIAQRPAELEWRAAAFDPEENTYADLDTQVAALHAFGLNTPEHLLGDALGYWLREWRVHLAGMLVSLQQDQSDQYDDPDVIGGLVCEGPVERIGKKGKPKPTPGMRFTFRPQQLSPKLHDGTKTVFTAADDRIGYATVDALDRDAGELTLVWNERCSELGVVPSATVLNDSVSPNPKPAAVSALAARLLDGTASTDRLLGDVLLRRNLPSFGNGGGPAAGAFTDDLESILAWATNLDGAVVAIQGPPGTGKTYTGAHIVLALVRADKRVGICAMSHAAIANLLREVVKVFTAAGEIDSLRAIVKSDDRQEDAPAGVTVTTDNKWCAKDEYNLVAGTTWLFSGNDMQAAPVDVLLIDEAGQLALVDALAATSSARNLILLGDPSQLPQVSQAVHPNDSGASVLEHILGTAPTIPAERGVFLGQTRRMHPDICDFISQQIYDGRLGWHPSCAIQTTSHGTGLRWLRAVHSGSTTSSLVEAQLVHRQIIELLGSSWTDAAGTTKVLQPNDIMVVAPYNDQVNLIRDVLRSDARTSAVRVGTVDKFQGQEAAVVLFTMTTSTAADMPRGPRFLFSKNRLNVAISRARCLAYLICTDELLDSRARDVEEMKLIATLCAFVDAATKIPVTEMPSTELSGTDGSAPDADL